MDISGSHRIPAPRSAVWAALHDPGVLKACIPGCERFERADDGMYEGVVATKVGPMKTIMTGLVTLVGAEAPQRLTITAKGADPTAGGGEGVGEVTLDEDGDGTLLSWEGSVEPEGKVGQLGQRLITGVMRKTLETTCANLAMRLEGAGPVPVEETPPPIAEAPPLVHEEPAEAPPGSNAPPLAAGVPTLAPITPTAMPDIPEPEAVAPEQAAGSSATARIMLVAAVVIVVGALVYYLLWQAPGAG